MQRISEVCDLVILVKTKGSLVIKQGLDDLGLLMLFLLKTLKKGWNLFELIIPKQLF